ncbi:hypothetical protein BASA50_010009 [Batrachochytrium salamandrivorans]|uniref:Uncharacterized protein n=1 Tax=Batrachochytrium salamandrivorans TaxID=1357716 RepID=A0ABQ8EZQ5_9FUNG|nr:hypothetical protein BASA60_011025 [Batrachochytrium salamandrivorans]KAH6565899.1 hypothetical protein BASA62_007002 [Batrachochytrium salamandrivorans]KAH6581872.1 hypothetical protein BASA61_008760 [Batrachochytrium salamandrivorans]KAH6583329.1 hypothetical protein BASA60_001511 [Batrachochytrium salamandrivorans]KAH6589500.1 hypothetical protein BASA50_010009 [Batrachochytrium salamandrivorans]
MKFNALVVAVMAIASVNAVLYEGLPGEHDELPSGSDELSSGYGELSSGDDELPSGDDELPSGDENSGGMAASELTQDLLRNNGIDPYGSEPTEKDQICGNIVKELDGLWSKIDDINYMLRSQMPGYSGLMEGIDENGEKIEESQLGLKQVAGYSALSDENKTKLGEVKAEYTGLEEKYGETWGEFIVAECSAELFRVLSPEAMIEEGHSLQFPNADGVTAPRKQ